MFDEPQPRRPARLPSLARRPRAAHAVAASLLAFVVAAITACATIPAPTPTALPSPIREARTIPQADGSIRIEAVSARVVPNQPYVFSVFTHCGFTTASFDFDGSFWAVLEVPAGFAGREGNPPAGIDNPRDTGVIVLVAPSRATWQSRAGAIVQLGRGPDEAQVFGCD